MQICTIGFTKKNLREFIDLLKSANVTKVIDIRLNNTSQLAGYAKKDDLEYILNLVGINYEHCIELAPTEDILKGYKAKKITWEEYEKAFNDLLILRKPENTINLSEDNGTICLLCSEDKPKHCHRRLVAEYFKAINPFIEIKHL